MFKAKRKDTQKIYTILDTFFDLNSKGTWFLIWENNRWCWRDADKFVPPNVDIENLKNS